MHACSGQVKHTPETRKAAGDLIVKLADKVALVTGGSHGIGKAIALALADAGADVALTFREREEGARQTARLIEEKGRRALVLQADVTDPEACREIVRRTAADLGQLDVLVNNAGGSRGGPLSELSLEDWQYTLDLCVTAAFLTSQAAARHMMPRGGGSIINISSVHSTHVWPHRTSYGVAKAALNRLTMSMAVEWAQHGLRTNAIAPGYINVAETEEEKARYEAGDNSSAPLIVAQRTAIPAEVAAVAVFLASDDASYVNGQTIFVDGGLLLPAVTTADFLRGDRSNASFTG
jgi:NAD(P)-dependent dehydrogenase (short-subunit alcohol dehydrogenase family)